ncbi:hypothetical protein AWC01_09010 [Mycobacterium doricum]|uniref:Uncharacterized protein n=1 Tax=Mycolicibacterium doricum TaxID=126673 RepID=A0A1X1TBW2_9MYCO|nr:hypothetical protein AWC01_09010 [Mycolicibacterium doricum]
MRAGLLPIADGSGDSGFPRRSESSSSPYRHPAPPPTIDDHYPYITEDEYQAFYTPPNRLPPGGPGDLIRTEPSCLMRQPVRPRSA